MTSTTIYGGLGKMKIKRVKIGIKSLEDVLGNAKEVMKKL